VRVAVTRWVTAGRKKAQRLVGQGS
jgi:hypothetical protein